MMSKMFWYGGSSRGSLKPILCSKHMFELHAICSSSLCQHFIYLTKQVMFKMNKICQMFALDVMVHPLKTSSPGLDYFTQKHF